MKTRTDMWRTLSIVTLSCIAAAVQAAPIMPDFSAVPTGWATDRYEPATFVKIGTFQGHSNVLAIGIDASTGYAARLPSYKSLFYSTQGRKYIFSTPQGAGSVLAADLFIPATWANSANGNARTDMWGTMVNASDVISTYAIIGFTNFGGAPRLRVWDPEAGTPDGWVHLNAGVVYDAWTGLAIELKADSSIVYYVNGVQAYVDATTFGSVAFKEVIMQAYNFEHPAISGAVVVPYTAYWSNTDSDNDGLPDSVDNCPTSNTAVTVVIDGIDTLVPNTLNASGCTISDLIAQCAASSTNHGDFVSCVANLLDALKDAGVITNQQKGAIQNAAAKSGIGK